MRKAGILVMAFVLVIGMSTIGFGAEIPVNLTVESFGRLVVPEGASFDLKLTDLSGDKKIVRGIKVQSNDGFQMTIDNNFDPSNFDNIYASDMWDADATNNSDWVFSPNVFLDKYPEEFGLTSNTKDYSGKWDNVGSHNGTLLVTGGEQNDVYVPSGSYTFDLGYDMGINSDSNWYDLPEGDYGKVGNVTVTISAYQN